MTTRSYTYRYARTRTETRSAFCPVCRVRLPAGRNRGQAFDLSPACQVSCAQGSAAQWRPVLALLRPYAVPWDCQAAQDALLAAQEGA